MVGGGEGGWREGGGREEGSAYRVEKRGEGEGGKGRGGDLGNAWRTTTPTGSLGDLRKRLGGARI